MFDVNHIIQGGGILAVSFIIFAESGLLLGFFLPGDSLLLAAGVFAGSGKLPLSWLLISVIVAAIVGYQVGYIFGQKAGPKLFKRKKGILFREDYLERTEKFFAKYGIATVVLGRFIAHVRTFISVIAGASSMNKRQYLIYNIIGAFLWGGGITLLGYWLGSKIPNIDHYIIPLIAVVLIVVYAIAVWQLVKSSKRRKLLKQGLKEDWDYFFKGKKDD